MVILAVEIKGTLSVERLKREKRAIIQGFEELLMRILHYLCQTGELCVLQKHLPLK